MQEIPQPVTGVSVYPYLPHIPIEVPAHFVRGVGTYAVGTLMMDIFYNLDLVEGTPLHGGVVAGVNYYALCQGADGETFQTPWMTCLQGGSAPRFGRTIAPVHETDAAAGTDATPDIAYQVHLRDVSVDLYVNPIEPLVVPLIRGASGIAKFAGLLPGGTWSAAVTGGRRVNTLRKGMRVSIGGINVNGGQPYHVPAVLTTTDAGDPALFREIKA
ncbi:MAG TPA: hypothetical protein VMU81_19665 [Acetobacteraceae bacterium]|nr:hypothetical protein [Acetobacteraceae bacterium]